jgi:hypothetical protein
VELFRGTITRHTAIAFGGDDTSSGVPDFDDRAVAAWVPLAVPTAVAIEERLSPGAAAALINRAHTDTDLVLFVDRGELDGFRAIDGHHTVGELGPGAAQLVERLWRHDLVVVDTSGSERSENEQP